MSAADDRVHAEKLGYEPRDVPARGVLFALVGLYASLVLSGVLVAALIAYFYATAAPPRATELELARPEQPRPHLEVAPSADRAAVEQAAREHLQGYAWIDRTTDRVQVPIERAMALIAERGWPDGEGTSAP